MSGIAELPVISQPVPLSAPLLDHLARRMRVAMESKLAELDLRPRHLIALTLLRDHGERSQADLAGLLRIDRTNLVGLLNDLEALGLIERRRAREDRRRHTVVLTTPGRRRLAEAEFALAAVEGDVLAALDADQRAALYTLLHTATGGSVPVPAGDC
jgi:MarR family transcriptional regulator, lower aerobic nicotinate degradation pathway regulator